MPHFKSIVVGVDFSDCSQSALSQALRLSAQEKAPVHVVHVIDPMVINELADTLPQSPTELETTLVSEVRDDLAAFVEKAGTGDSLRLHAPVGDAFEQIQKIAAEHRADIVVLGVFGPEGGGRGAGALAVRCVRHLSTRVLLVHERHRDPFGRIVSCVDFSPTSAGALRDAMTIAAHDQADLYVLHVYDPPWNKTHYRAATSGSTPAFQNQYTMRLQSRLESFVAEETASLERTTMAKCEIFEYPSHGRGIVEYAKRHEADLVVLGTLGHSALRYLFIGRTAERVLRELECSVLAVKPAQSTAATPE